MSGGSFVKLTDEFIEKVSAETDIVSVVSGYVQLKRKGNRYWGCCPFHHEKTASFSVKPDEGFFYCFGCHAGGNAFKFISMVENLNYYDAIRMQAERLNIPLPVAEQSPQEIAREAHLKDMRKLHELAMTFFHNCLTKTPYGTEGLAYLHGRGITDGIIQEFHIGFAPDAWSKLSTAFQKRGVSVPLLMESGLIVERNGGGNYDRFRKRIMIPICDERDRVVAFGGRIIGDGEPKYLNSPETAIFNKRNLLFGLNKAQKAIQKAGFALVVEGYMDVISVYAAGIHNVVASLGTAFTQEQCRKLMRYGAELYFCYDSDAAGQNAIVRGLSIAKSIGAVVKVVSIPEGKDPDEYIRKHGAEAFRKVIENAMPMMDFYVKYVSERVDISRLEGKLQAKNELAPLLASIRDAAEQRAYISRISRMLSITEGEIRQQMRQSNYQGQGYVRGNNAAILQQATGGSGAVPQRQMAVHDDNGIRRGCRVVIRSIWEGLSEKDKLLSRVPMEFLPAWMQEVLKAVEATVKEGEAPNRDVIMSHISETSGEELSRALVEELGQDMEIMYNECVKYLRTQYLKQYHEVVRQRMLSAGDAAKQIEASKELLKIQREMDEFKK